MNHRTLIFVAISTIPICFLKNRTFAYAFSGFRHSLDCNLNKGEMLKCMIRDNLWAVLEAWEDFQVLVAIAAWADTQVWVDTAL